MIDESNIGIKLKRKGYNLQDMIPFSFEEIKSECIVNLFILRYFLGTSPILILGDMNNHLNTLCIIGTVAFILSLIMQQPLIECSVYMYMKF